MPVDPWGKPPTSVSPRQRVTKKGPRVPDESASSLLIGVRRRIANAQYAAPVRAAARWRHRGSGSRCRSDLKSF